MIGHGMSRRAFLAHTCMFSPYSFRYRTVFHCIFSWKKHVEAVCSFVGGDRGSGCSARVPHHRARINEGRAFAGHGNPRDLVYLFRIFCGSKASALLYAALGVFVYSIRRPASRIGDPSSMMT